MSSLMKSNAAKGLATALVISLVSSTAFLAPKRSEAIVGLILTTQGVTSAAGWVLFQVGFGVAGAGLLLTMAAVGGTLVIDDGRHIHVIPIEGNGNSKLAFGGLMTLAAGVLLLDESATPVVSLQSLSGAQAETLGLTRAEHVAYENEREELNLLNQEAHRELMVAKQAGQTKIDLSPLLVQAQSQVSAEARSAVAKISRSLLAKMSVK